MADVLLLGALAKFYTLAQWRSELRDYLFEHRIDLAKVLPAVGAIGIMDVVEYPDDRFDFVGQGRLISALVFEALDADEQPFDLVALPICEPERPMTMFGRVGFLAPDNVLWPGSYSMGKSMPVHRHARDWLAAGCIGTAIIRPAIAAREMLDLPGPLLPEDFAHARELRAIADSVVRRDMILLPERRAAA